jgi:3',5'-cyclic-AMP phosphodiesterase
MTNEASSLDPMTFIAHLSDLHLLEEGHEKRTGTAWRRLAYISLGRPKSASARRRRALDALVDARKTGAHHLVVTGDLTEDGLPEQFEMAASVLEESRWPADKVTLVPGNHDVYTDPDAWDRALEGPLRAYRATSSTGLPVHLPATVLLPLSTAFTQHYTRSAGTLRGHEVEAAGRAAEQARLAGSALVVAMHHSPRRHHVLPLQWIDGLLDHAALAPLLDAHDHLHVLHGHVHFASDKAVRPGATPRIFSTEAVVDGDKPLRIYRARHGKLWPEPAAAGGLFQLAPA